MAKSNNTKQSKARTNQSKAKASAAPAGVTIIVPGEAHGRGRVGIVQAIRELVEAATPSKPVTKAAIVDELAKRYPDRDRAGMANTVSQQLAASKPGGLVQRWAKAGMVLGTVELPSGATGYCALENAEASRKVLDALAQREASRSGASTPITPVAASKASKPTKAKASKPTKAK